MDILADLNESQREAVTHVDGPLLILAGAGSGKTRVITRRVAYLIEQGIAPWHVLAITFTNRAAGELARRIEALGVARGVTACTFHSLCARLLREFAVEAGLSPSYTIYDTADQTRLVKLSIERAGVGNAAFTPGKVLALVSRAKLQLKTAAVAEAEADSFAGRKFAKVYQAYEDALTAACALDFDDLLMRMVFLFRDRPDVRDALAARYQYLLIDEYQDTNHPQYILAHAIALDSENICVTGDPDQSIYSWRGADIGNILDFEADYPNARVVRLEENYRSTTPILDAAGRLIARNRQRRDKTLFTRREGGDDVTILTATDEHTEAAEVVARARALAADGIGYDGIAVFYRLNSLSRVLEDAFRRARVPYRIARGVEFFNRKEIKDVVGYLKLLHNAADEVACERIINVPPRGIGSTTLKRLRAYAQAHGISLFAAAERAADVAALGKAAVTKVGQFAKLIGELGALAGGSVKALAEAVVAKTDMEAYLKAAGGEDGSELANVYELITSAAEFDAAGEGGLPEYLNDVALISDLDHFDGGSGAVTLMTLHAAKGLEFPAVFIVGCEEGVLPFHRARETDRGDEEERRLCFVGMTRAKTHLCLSHVQYRGIRGVRQRQARSHFVAELHGEHVVEVDVSDPPAAGGLVYHAADDFQPDEPVWQQRRKIEAVADEEFFDADIEAELDAAADGNGGLAAGDRVRHPSFGPGRVERIRRTGPYTRVVVDFQRLGRKTLILQYAKLERLP